MAANVVFPAGGANSAPQNSLAGFKGPLRSERKRREREKWREERREWTKRTG